MNVGFIGAGKMASTLMEKVDAVNDASIIAICDVNEDAALEAAESHGASVYTDHKTMYAEESLDAVFIAIPPFAYGDQVSLAAKYGVNVFVEKPVALKLIQGRETLEAIEASDIVTGTGYTFRYDEITEVALELLEDREISLMNGRYWSGLLASSWGNELELSGGEIVTRATHIYDTIRYFGGDIELVSASGTDRLGTEDIDYPDATTARLEHKNGIISTVSSGVTSPEWVAELDILGDGLSLRLDYASQELTSSVDGDEVHYEFATDRYGREVEAFLDAVRTGDQSHVRSTFDDALRTLSLNWTVIDAAGTGEIAAVGETQRS